MFCGVTTVTSWRDSDSNPRSLKCTVFPVIVLPQGWEVWKLLSIEYDCSVDGIVIK